MSLENFNRIYENDTFYVEVEISSIPWLKIHDKKERKELSMLSKEERYLLFDMTNAIENRMIAFYAPYKINIASFGNYLPQVHMHIMARFKEDAFFPEPMWGERQRDDKNFKGDFDTFLEGVKECLQTFN